MKLYNKYQNKDLLYLINYINDSYKESESVDDFIRGLSSADNDSTNSNSFISTILNREDKSSRNLNIFYEEDAEIVPLLYRDNGLPILFSHAERAWLEYILSNSLALRFLKPEVVHDLLYILKDTDSPICDEYIDIRKSKQGSINNIDIDYHSLIHYVQDCIIIEYKLKGVLEQEYTLLPYRIKQNPLTGRFELMGISTDNDSHEIIFVDISTISYFENSKLNNSPKYKNKDLHQFAEHIIQNQKQEPIELEIINGAALLGSNKGTMAADRAAHIFSMYDSINYINSDNNLVMKISYYKFQYNELLSQIMSLGRYVKVVSPTQVRDDILKRVL